MRALIITFFTCFLGITIQVAGQKTEEATVRFLQQFNEGKYDLALPLAMKAVEEAILEFGRDDVNYAFCCQNVGVTYNKLYDWNQSNNWMHEAIRAFIAATETDQLVEVHVAYNILGTNFLNLRQYDSARAYLVVGYNYFLQYPDDQYENLLVLAENLCEVSFSLSDYDDILVITSTLDSLVAVKSGIYSEPYYKLLINSAGAYRKKPEFVTAIELYKMAIPICDSLFGSLGTEYADLLQLQAECYRNLGRMQECAIRLDSAGFIYKNTNVTDVFTIANYHSNLANYLGEVAQFEPAYLHYDTALQLLEDAGLKDVLLYGACLSGKAYTYMDAAMYADAMDWLQRTDDWMIKQYGDSYPMKPEILMSKANVQYFTHQLNSATSNSEEAIRLLNEKGDTTNYLLGRCYALKALIEHGKGNSQEGIALCLKAIDLDNRAFGDSNIFAANNLSNLGIIYQELGEYALAEKVIRESFAIKWKVYGGANHPQIAYSLGNWATIQLMQGRYQDADQLLAAAVEILKVNNMFGTSNGRAILNNVALLAQKQGDYTTAKNMYRQVLESTSSGGKVNSPVYLTALANMSTLLLEEGRNDSALYYSKLTMEVAKNTYGEESAMYQKAGNNALVALMKIGELGDARKIGNDLLPLVKRTQGDSSELMSLTLSNLSTVELYAGNFERAAILQQQALDIQLYHYKLNLYALSERDQIAWWTKRAALFQLQPALLARVPTRNEKLEEKMINQQLQLKGYILNNARSVLQKIRSIQNPQLQQLTDLWQFTKNLAISESSKPISERRYNVDSLQYLANSYEQNINLAAGNLLKDAADINWQVVQQNLGPGEAAVEFIRFPEVEGNRYGEAFRFAALVIPKKGKPSIVSLGREEAIRWCLAGGEKDGREILISKLYRTKIGNVGTVLFTGDSLYKLLWQPLEPYLTDARIVHIAPEGILHKIAFAALPVGSDSVLIDKVELRQYASVRQVRSIAMQPVSIKTAFVAGNADFNVNAATPESTAWTSLPGTAQEIAAINRFFLSKGKKVTMVEAKAATELAVRSLGEPSPDIIHIATHGFFLPQPEEKKTAASLAGQDPAFLEEYADPLMRSGIVLAGANQYWGKGNAEKPGDDGVLTAFELAQLNWENTKVVTLSACETGLGEVQDGEGVFGLKRAIKLAGAQYTLLSLWQVPDAETAELMSDFYEKMLAGLPVRRAFFEAQMAMRKKYKPFEWAAFVLSE